MLFSSFIFPYPLSSSFLAASFTTGSGWGKPSIKTSQMQAKKKWWGNSCVAF